MLLLIGLVAPRAETLVGFWAVDAGASNAPERGPREPNASAAQQFRLGGLKIRGNDHTRLEFILSLIPLNPGDLFDRSKWDWGLEQINRSGLFEPVSPGDVVFNFDYANGVVYVELNLKERDRQRVDFSGGAGTTGGSNLGLDYSNINLTGRGDRLRARGALGTRERSAAGGYSITTLAKTPVTVDVSGSYQRLQFVDAKSPDANRQPLFVEQSSGASLGVAFPLGRSSYRIGAPLRAGFLYSFSSTNLADSVSGAPVPTIEQKGIRIGAVSASLVYNTLDREFDPMSGHLLSLGFEVSGRALGGSFNSIKPSLDYRWFVPLGPEQPYDREPRVLGLRVRASHVAAAGKPFRPEVLSSAGGVPLFRRFFLGGETEVRGYDVNSIAPLARVDRLFALNGGTLSLIETELRPIGGDTRLLFNAEYRVPLIWRVSAAAFVDLGASFNVRRFSEERIESKVQVAPLNTPGTIVTVLRPLGANDPRLPSYRVSLGGELRVTLPVLNIPLRFILAANPNAQRGLPPSVVLAPERRFEFRLGFSRTL